MKLLITGIDELPDRAKFSISQNYPNPFEENTHFNIYLPEDDRLSINIFNASGQVVLSYEKYLPEGEHSFTFTGSSEKLYLLSAKTSTFSSAIKMLNGSGLGNSAARLEYDGNKFLSGNSKKGKSEFDYNTGDSLVFTGYMTDGAGKIHADTITDTPAKSMTYTFNFKNPNRIVILMYHKITDSVPDNEYERNSTVFENDLIYVRDHNYQLLSLEDLLLLRSGQMELISDGIIFTFDDGYESNYTEVFPLLTEYKMPATFFLTTEWIETEDFMSWPEVELMSGYTDNEGKRLFDMGSHSCTHPFLEKSLQYYETHDDYLNFLNTELKDSKDRITAVTGQNNIFFSLPYGDGVNNTDIITKAMEIGYKGIRSSVWNSFAIEEMNIYALPSIPILSGSSIDIIENYIKQ